MSQASAPRPKINVVVLISGSGTNLQALIDGQETGELPITIQGVVSNRPGVKGLERARSANIATTVLDHKAYPDRENFDTDLMASIDQHEPDLIVLAGFMRILTPGFVQHYRGRLFNIHPSLLPKYPGLHTHQRALEAGDAHHGVTVHFVTEELDGGPAVIQAMTDILPDDTPDTLAVRVQQQEHRIYPQAVRWFAEGRLKLKDGRAYLDNELLPAEGYLIDATTQSAPEAGG